MTTSSRWLMRQFTPFVTARIRQNYRLLSSSAASSAVRELQSPESQAVDAVYMTDSCIQRIKELQAKEEKGKMLRLSIEAGGCSGFQYDFSLDDKTNDDDRTFERDGVKLVVDKISFDFVKGATVDYVEELIRSAFQNINVLNGHSGRISGLAFSNSLDVLVSSGSDFQIVVWDSTRWEKKKSTKLQTSSFVPSELSETYIQIHQDQKHFLAVHETQLAVYETTTLELVKQWMIGNFCARISNATFSCDSRMIYAVLTDGIILILDAAELYPRFEIDPSAYLPSNISSHPHPLVVAAHPRKTNQFALGLTDGGVIVVEPQESEGKWSPSITITSSL